MSVYVGARTRGAIPMRPVSLPRAWRGLAPIVPVLAVLVATLPAWIGVTIDLPILWSGDLDELVLNEEQAPVEVVAEPDVPFADAVVAAVSDTLFGPSMPDPPIVAR